MNANEYLDQIEKRAEAAADGPWRSVAHRGVQSDEIHAHDGNVCYRGQTPTWDADAEFISASRTDVPKMAKALRAVLGMVHEGEMRSKMNLARMLDGAPFPPILVAEDVRRAITEALEGEE